MSKAREWELWHGEGRIIAKGECVPGQVTRVVEVTPDSIVITREELHEAIDYCMGSTAIFRDQLLDELFGKAVGGGGARGAVPVLDQDFRGGREVMSDETNKPTQSAPDSSLNERLDKAKIQYCIDELRDGARKLRETAPAGFWHYEALEHGARVLESRASESPLQTPAPTRDEVNEKIKRILNHRPYLYGLYPDWTWLDAEFDMQKLADWMLNVGTDPRISPSNLQTECESGFGWKEIAETRAKQMITLAKFGDEATARIAELQAEVERLRAALEKIACFNDTAKHLDEPVSATIAREALK